VARFVLVHGAFSGAWCWDPVIESLEAVGHTVEAADLPGSGDDKTPLEEVTLDAYANSVCATLRERAEPAVLVGYSMGGVVITQAADRCTDRVAHLVFVCAFMPSNGQSLLDMAQLPESDDQIQANLTIDGDPPVARLSEEATAKVIYNDCTSDQVAWAVAKRQPQAVAPYTTAVEIDDAKLASIPRSYVLTERDQALSPALQRRMIREHPCEHVFELAADHAPNLSATDELVSALLEVAS